MNKENDEMIRRQQTKTGTTKRKYEGKERPNEQLNYINNMKTGMTELTTINQSTSNQLHQQRRDSKERQ